MARWRSTRKVVSSTLTVTEMIVIRAEACLLLPKGEKRDSELKLLEYRARSILEPLPIIERTLLEWKKEQDALLTMSQWHVLREWRTALMPIAWWLKAIRYCDKALTTVIDAIAVDKGEVRA